MASNNDKSMTTVIGLVLLVGGAGLAWGYQMSHSLASNLSQVFTGALPDAVMYRYIVRSAVLRGCSCW